MLACPQISSSVSCRPVALGARPIGVANLLKQQQRGQSQRAQALAFSSSLRGCSNSFAGLALNADALLERQSPPGSASRQVTRMGNAASGGPFSWPVVQARKVIGKKRFNKLRGKAISLHSQVIKDFTMQYLGADSKISQGLIRNFSRQDLHRGVHFREVVDTLCLTPALIGCMYLGEKQTAKKNGEKLGFLA